MSIFGLKLWLPNIIIFENFGFDVYFSLALKKKKIQNHMDVSDVDLAVHLDRIVQAVKENGLSSGVVDVDTLNSVLETLATDTTVDTLSVVSAFETQRFTYDILRKVFNEVTGKLYDGTAKSKMFQERFKKIIIKCVVVVCVHCVYVYGFKKIYAHI